MNVTAVMEAARRTLAANLYVSTCSRREGGSVTGQFNCYYEQTPPQSSGILGFETGGGYGYTVFAKPEDVTKGDGSIAMKEGNAITVDGLTMEVQHIPPVGNLDHAVRFECTKR